MLLVPWRSCAPLTAGKRPRFELPVAVPLPLANGKNSRTAEGDEWLRLRRTLLAEPDAATVCLCRWCAVEGFSGDGRREAGGRPHDSCSDGGFRNVSERRPALRTPHLLFCCSRMVFHAQRARLAQSGPSHSVRSRNLGWGASHLQFPPQCLHSPPPRLPSLLVMHAHCPWWRRGAATGLCARVPDNFL